MGERLVFGAHGQSGTKKGSRDMDPKFLLLGLFLCSGAVMSLISVPLILGKVAPNPWYGFRVKRTLEDPAVWYAANRYASWWMLSSAVGLMLVAAAVYYFLPGLGVAPYSLTCLAAAVVGLGLGLVQTLRYIRRLSDTGRR